MQWKEHKDFWNNQSNVTCPHKETNIQYKVLLYIK